LLPYITTLAINDSLLLSRKCFLSNIYSQSPSDGHFLTAENAYALHVISLYTSAMVRVVDKGVL